MGRWADHAPGERAVERREHDRDQNENCERNAHRPEVPGPRAPRWVARLDTAGFHAALLHASWLLHLNPPALHTLTSTSRCLRDPRASACRQPPYLPRYREGVAA